MQYTWFNYDGTKLDAFDGITDIKYDGPIVILYDGFEKIAIINLMPGQWITR